MIKSLHGSKTEIHPKSVEACLILQNYIIGDDSMLHLRIKAFENPELLQHRYKIKQEQNIDALFMKLKIKVTNEAKQLVADIDHGKLIDSYSFIDRFGNQHNLNDLSTGCKAALLVCFGNNEIDFTSSGQNAIEATIRNVKHGKMVIPTPGSDMEYDIDNPEQIDVEIDGYRFGTIPRLNDYIQEEWPDEPDLDTGFVEKVE